MPLFVVDAFTDEAFGGNPAAVCVVDDDVSRTDDWMLAVAAEMKHSETAFVRRRSEAHTPVRERRAEEWNLRWFTPTVEVDLCGHATLATAHVLWTEAIVDPANELRFHTRSGPLHARAVHGGVELDFPALVNEPVDAPAALTTALGVEPVAVFRNAHDLVVELSDAAAVHDLAPDVVAIASIEARAVVVTASSDDPGVDFVSRTFAPRVGVDEDPVTGSAHCALAPYWAPRLGRTALVGRQLSARGGTVRCALVTTADGDTRVLLSGSAVTVLRGTLTI